MELMYESLPCKELINISALVSVQYLELSKNFTFHTEYHKCWEINFVDRGSVLLYVDGREVELHKHELILYAPMVEHGILKKTEDAPDICSMAFESESEMLYRLSGRIITVSDDLQKLLSRAFEYTYNFSETGIELNKPGKYEKQNEKKDIILELIFITVKEMLLRMLLDENKDVNIKKTIVENATNDSFDKIINYINSHLDEKLSLEKISNYYFISKSKLCHDVKAASGLSVQELVKREKLATAKRMIREEHYNITEISKKLGFTSLHYFSAWFKNKTRMSPTEYASSVKARSGF